MTSTKRTKPWREIREQAAQRNPDFEKGVERERERLEPKSRKKEAAHSPQRGTAAATMR